MNDSTSYTHDQKVYNLLFSHKYGRNINILKLKLKMERDLGIEHIVNGVQWVQNGNNKVVKLTSVPNVALI